MNHLKRKSKMKERIEVRNDSFVDYKGIEHHFTIVAISKELPKKTNDFDDLQSFEGDEKVYYEVNEYVDDYGTTNYLGNVCKVLCLGLAICNPVDIFNEEIGKFKAIARARNNNPVLYSTNPGTINSKVVNALLEQEAEFFKNNPSKFIKGYDESKKAYELKVKRMEMVKEFSDFELSVAVALEDNPNSLDKVKEYLKYKSNVKNS